MVCITFSIELMAVKQFQFLKEAYTVAYLKATTKGCVKVKTVLRLWFQVHLLFVGLLWSPWEEHFLFTMIH